MKTIKKDKILSLKIIYHKRQNELFKTCLMFQHRERSLSLCKVHQKSHKWKLG